ncbi:histidine kinase [Microbacterium sp. TPD7012]|nr:histidine kinase [Microbacterium sp. TPD7012]
MGRLIRSRRFWEQRSLHPVARLFLVAVVGVLVCIAIGFIVAHGTFSRFDLLAIAFYAALATFAWHPTIAALMVMFIGSVGVVFTGSGGDLLELAIALSLVAATCVPWVIIAHGLLLAALTTYIAVSGSTLATGGVFGILGIAIIAFLAGLAFRLVAAREAILVAERARVVKDLEAIAREEQERIADELHDGIAHDLTLILFHARALPKQTDDTEREVSLTTIEESAEQALDSIQSLLSLMRDTQTEAPAARPSRYDGVAREAISSLGGLLNDAGIPTRVSAPNTQLAISSVSERLLTEIAIEAVTNIIKHAPNSPTASLDIIDKVDGVELVVKNTAPSNLAARPISSGGRGLSRARQRLARDNGELEWGHTDEGWVLRAIVPATPEQRS